MSSVTDMFVIVGDSEDGYAEDIAPRVADAIRDFEDHPRLSRLPVISLCRKDWEELQGGSKVAGSAVIWFGWNYGRPDELADYLKAQGFKHITVWSHHENDAPGPDSRAPKVVSW